MSLIQLKQMFLTKLTEDTRHSWEDCANLEDRLATMLQHCQATWPELTVSPTQFVAHLAQHVRSDSEPGTFSPYVSDQYLALGAVICGNAGVQLLNMHALNMQARLLRKRRLSEEDIHELLHTLRVRLVVGTESSPPRLLRYSGSAPLASWLRAVTLNLLHNTRSRRNAQNLSIDDDSQLLHQLLPSHLSTSGTSEQSPIDRRFGKFVVRDAMRTALHRLKPAQRLLLKLYYVDGLRMEQIAILQRSNKSTISRHIAAARAQILDSLRLELKQNLRMSTSEADSLVELVISSIEISLSKILTE